MQRDDVDDYRAHFEHAPDPYVVTDAAGVIVSGNLMAARLLGVPAGELRGTRLARFLQEGDRVDFYAALSRLGWGESESADFELQIHGQGGPLPVWARVGAMPGTDKKVDGLRWLLRDVAERRRERVDLEEALKLRDSVVLAVAHDVRSPLAVVLGMGSLLEEHFGELPPERTLDVLRRLNRNARRINQVVLDLLDLARVLEERVGVQLRPVDVGALVREAIGQVDMRGHVVMIEAPDSVPAFIDAGLYRRIVVNLLANAARHSPDGAGVVLSLREEPDGVVLDITDRGPGVAAERADAVFDLFHVDEERPRDGGLGIGLFLVRRFAELQGGRAWVEPRADGGSSFRVMVPGR